MPDLRRIEDLRRRVQQDPASIAFAQLAEEHRRAGEYHQAIRVSRAGLAHHPHYLSARVTLGRSLLALGRLDDAEAELANVLSAAADNLVARDALAELRVRRAALPSADAGSTILDPVEAGSNVPSGMNSAEVGSHESAKNPAGTASHAITRLEAWLGAIVADRERRRRAGS